MKYTFFQLFTALLLIASQACSQQIYSKAYGNPENPAIIYIHGGPRGNATLFEGTTAPLLAQKGFYVIAYDRRGEGRSKDTAATMTFNEAITDLDNLMQEYQLKTATILGHSFGGIVATLFTNARPKRVKRLILAGALFSQQETYDHILKSTSQTAIAKKDSAMLKQISYIKTLNHNSAEFRKKCYEIASAYGYFRMPYSTPQSIQLEADYKNSEFGRANIRNDQAPLLFYKNEKQVNIDTKQILRNIKTKGVKLFGIYGKQDRIFSNKQLQDIQNIIGLKYFDTIDNCSHYPFVDQQKIFVDDVVKFMRL